MDSRGRGKPGITVIIRTHHQFFKPHSKSCRTIETSLPTSAIGPLSLWDAEYGCASFVKQTADIAADKLFRLRSNRVLYGAPVAYTGIGRPRVHEDKFKLNGPQLGGYPSNW
jgi:hypothetical protein